MARKQAVHFILDLGTWLPPFRAKSGFELQMPAIVQSRTKGLLKIVEAQLQPPSQCIGLTALHASREGEWHVLRPIGPASPHHAKRSRQFASPLKHAFTLQNQPPRPPRSKQSQTGNIHLVKHTKSAEHRLPRGNSRGWRTAGDYAPTLRPAELSSLGPRMFGGILTWVAPR